MTMEQFLRRWSGVASKDHQAKFLADVRKLADTYYQLGRSDEYENFHPQPECMGCQSN